MQSNYESLANGCDVSLTVLRQRLRDRTSASLVAELLPAAYWHPNGFLKIRIANDPDGASFRIHLWPKKSPGSDQIDDIHSHRWQYYSKVLYGSLKVETYQETPQGRARTRRFSCSQNNEGVYRLSPECVVNFDGVSATVISRGSSHEGGIETIHRTQAYGSGPVLSAFMQSASTSSRSHVYLTGDETSERLVQCRPAEPDDLRIVFDLLLSTEGT